MINQLVYMFKNNVMSSKKLQWYLGGFAALGLLLSITLVCVGLIEEAPPSAETASVEKVQEYMGSSRFLDLNTRERGKYVRRVAKRFESMSHSEKMNTGKIFRNLRKKNTKAARAIQMTYIAQKAVDFQKLSKNEKNRKIDEMLNHAELAQGRKKVRKEARKHLNKKPSKAECKKAMKRAMRDSSNVFNNTTASERAKIARSMGDVLERARQRYGK